MLCSAVCKKLAYEVFAEHPEFQITASMGIATYPDQAANLEELKEFADKALYSAKEGGRNRALLFQKNPGQKHEFTTIAEKNRTVDRIFDTICHNQSFLLLGHELPDEDCISSLVAMALLIQKFGKTVSLYIRNEIPDQLSYMTNICSYNKIKILQHDDEVAAIPDIIGVLDTPKPEMVSMNQSITRLLEDRTRTVFELDHHLSADAAYIGSEGYCLVYRASSTCELIGFLCCKLTNRKDILESFQITELFSRNLVLSMLTGMIGDTKFGLTMKTNRDIFFYKLFTQQFAKILHTSAHKNSKNYRSMTDIFNTIQTLSPEETELYQKLLSHAHFFEKTGYVILDEKDSYSYLHNTDYHLFVNVIKSVTDFLSEKSGTYGLSVYYDMPEMSNLIQFRIRTARDVAAPDLRVILSDFGITDGGGHPGAIGFRIQKENIQDLNAYVRRILNKIESL